MSGSHCVHGCLPRSPGDEACCALTVLQMEPHPPCPHPGPRTRYLRLGSTDAIHCPGLGCDGDPPSPELTWYQVRVASPYPRAQEVFVQVCLSRTVVWGVRPELPKTGLAPTRKADFLRWPLPEATGAVPAVPAPCQVPETPLVERGSHRRPSSRVRTPWKALECLGEGAPNKGEGLGGEGR